jgi:acetyl-CoA C-acetyltransferase
MEEIVIVSAARTPFGKFGGALASYQATELGGMAVEQALLRAGISGDAVDEAILGMVISAGAGQVPARQAAVKGGIPHTVPSFTINKVCGSSLKAVELGAQIIKAGDADVIVAGGMESMSNAPYLLPSARWGQRMFHGEMVDAMVKDGLWCPENDVHMAVIGGQVAAEYGITRQEMDAWSVRSQQRWAAGEAAGAFEAERFPVAVTTKKGTVMVTRDEAPRPETTLETLSRLKPLFDPEGAITAGNAPGVNDGASALVLMRRSRAEALGAPILATIRGYAQVAQESRYISTVPGLAIQALMKRYDLTLGNFDLMEINEAFAAVPLVSGRKILGMDAQEMEEKMNVNGGAVAVGHPIGASGGRILMTLIHALKQRGQKSGVCAICSGMGQGDAVWITVE